MEVWMRESFGQLQQGGNQAGIFLNMIVKQQEERFIVGGIRPM